MLTAITPLFIGFLVTMTMMLALRPVASQFGLVDVPGGRKSHSGEVPVIGGIAMFMGLMAAVLAVDVASPREAALMVAAALMVIVGVMDDRFDLAPYARLLAHIAAAVTLVLASGHNVESLGNLLGLGDIGLGPFDLVFTVVAAIALINGFNMLDGLDGLAGGVALVALMGLSFYFLGGQGGAALVVSLGLVGSIVAFLIFNLPARFNRPFLAFMGDAGSTMLGFVLAGLALLAVQPRGAGMPPVVVLWLLPVPILELFTSTIRRAVTGLSPMQADRGHFHHRLLDAGLLGPRRFHSLSRRLGDFSRHRTLAVESGSKRTSPVLRFPGAVSRLAGRNAQCKATGGLSSGNAAQRQVAAAAQTSQVTRGAKSRLEDHDEPPAATARGLPGQARRAIA